MKSLSSIGRFDEDGFMILTDRAKAMIISGGFNLYPSDLEAVLVTHPAVEEAAVFDVASERWGETPVAAVVLKPGMTLAAEELKAWADARLAKNQRPHALNFMETLLRNVIGKIDKKRLCQSFCS